MTITDRSRTTRHTHATPTEITLTPMSPTIGAVIGGVDLRRDLSDETVDAIRAALLAWKVVFFRDQDITTEQHLAFARRFGELEVHPFAPQKPGHPEVLAITHDADSPGFENIWHSDVTWRAQPSLGSVLRLVEGPTIGGDTVFADMYAAFDGLPQPVRDRVEGEVARHDFPNFRARMRRKGATQDELDQFDRVYANPHHPVIRTHPETGRRAIYVNAAFTQEIVGMDPTTSAELLQILYRQASVPEYQVRFGWEPNSIAFWDNRSCQHYAVSDYWPNVRRVERVTIIGDTPYYDASLAPTDVAPRPFRGAVATYAAS